MHFSMRKRTSSFPQQQILQYCVACARLYTVEDFSL